MSSAPPFTYANYAVDREAKIATVTLSSPQRGNPAPWWTEREFLALIDEWEADDDVKVVILRSDKEDFSVGHDFGGYHDAAGTADKEGAGSNRRRYMMQREGTTFFRRLMGSLKPTIAEVRGNCIEWGCLVAALCDITIAANDAHFGMLGQAAGNSGVHYLPVYIELIGHKRAREMMITGRTVSGKTAAEIGLANRSVPVGELAEEVMNEAQRVALLPVDEIVLGKAYAEAAYENMGLLTGHATTTLAWMLGLRMKFKDDEFSVLKAVRTAGVREALHQRSGRYEPFGGFGAENETPIVRERRAPSP